MYLCAILKLNFFPQRKHRLKPKINIYNPKVRDQSQTNNSPQVSHWLLRLLLAHVHFYWLVKNKTVHLHILMSPYCRFFSVLDKHWWIFPSKCFNGDHRNSDGVWTLETGFLSRNLSSPSLYRLHFFALLGV